MHRVVGVNRVRGQDILARRPSADGFHRPESKGARSLTFQRFSTLCLLLKVAPVSVQAYMLAEDIFKVIVVATLLVIVIEYALE